MLAAVLATGLALFAILAPVDPPPCGPGFRRLGPRCCPGRSASGAGDVCARENGACPEPLVETGHGCDAREGEIVEIARTVTIVGPSDWEAEGRVPARTVTVEPFALDRFEVSTGRACAEIPTAYGCDPGDPARAASRVPLAAARAYCAARRGRLPSEDEWVAAAAGDRPRRYPWGDTGAVCRRAAWGLATGPCASGATGPDSIGAHAEGITPHGIHDLGGNVAEWVEPACAPGARCPDVVRGGAWDTRLATELRTWLRREVSEEAARRGDTTIGFRCAYDRAR